MIPAAEALQRLRDGNRRFVAGDPVNASAVDAAKLAKLTGGQSPFAVVLACSDSRVPVELVFDQGPGDLFVIRVAGNVATPSQIGSIEFAATQLGAQLVIVLGHGSCGAIAAALDSIANKAPPPSANLAEILSEIRPALEGLGNITPDEAVLANVHQSIKRLE